MTTKVTIENKEGDVTTRTSPSHHFCDAMYRVIRDGGPLTVRASLIGFIAAVVVEEVEDFSEESRNALRAFLRREVIPIAVIKEGISVAVKESADLAIEILDE